MLVASRSSRRLLHPGGSASPPDLLSKLPHVSHRSRTPLWRQAFLYHGQRQRLSVDIPAVSGRTHTVPQFRQYTRRRLLVSQLRKHQLATITSTSTHIIAHDQSTLYCECTVERLAVDIARVSDDVRLSLAAFTIACRKGPATIANLPVGQPAPETPISHHHQHIHPHHRS